MFNYIQDTGVWKTIFPLITATENNSNITML